MMGAGLSKRQEAVMRWSPALALAVLVLAGCQGVPGAPWGLSSAAATDRAAGTAQPATLPPPKPACPPYQPWSAADLGALRTALVPIPEGSILMRLALDWRRLYGDEIACHKVRGAQP